MHNRIFIFIFLGGGEAAGMHKGKAIQRGIEAMLGEGLTLMEVEIDSGVAVNLLKGSKSKINF